MHAHIPENHWQCECSKSDDPGTNAGTHYPCIFRNLCVKGARDNTSAAIKKAQQCLHFLRRLKKVELPIPAMTLFYRGTVESLLTYCISSWFGSCTAEERHNLSRIVRTAEKIIGVSLPQLQDIYTERCVRRAGSILKDCTHPFYGLFSLMQSGKRYRSIKTRTTRLLNSFLPTAIRLLNQSL